MIVQILVGVVFIAVTCGVVFMMKMNKKLKESGMNAIAIIIDKSIDNSGKNVMRYEITYQFSVSGVTYESDKSTDRKFYDSLEKGMQIQIMYDPEFPEHSNLAHNLNKGNAGVYRFFLVSGVMLASMVAVAYYNVEIESYIKSLKAD